MKSLFFCLFYLLALSMQAQTPANKTKLPSLADLIIKDSTGAILTKEKVQEILDGGKYGIRIWPDGINAKVYRLPASEMRGFNGADPPESEYFKTGQKISSFKETDISGTKYSLKDLESRIVVLNFWFIDCMPCRQEIPELNKLVERYKNNSDVVFIAVALDEKYKIQDFLKTTPFNYNIIYSGRYIASKYGIQMFPTHVIIDKQGKVLFHTTGLYPETTTSLKKWIEKGLNEKTQ